MKMELMMGPPEWGIRLTWDPLEEPFAPYGLDRRLAMEKRPEDEHLPPDDEADEASEEELEELNEDLVEEKDFKDEDPDA